MDTAKLKEVIRSLSKIQRDAFDRICCGDDSRVNRNTGESLIKRSLVRSFEGYLRGCRVKRYDFLLPAHVAWCELCEEELEASGKNTDTYCPVCKAERLLIENRRICPNGHGKSIPVGVRGRDLEKAERKRVEIVPADLTKVPLAGFTQ